MFQKMDRALNHQLLGAADDNFLLSLHMPHLGYSGFTKMDLLIYLYATYAVITNSNWLANDKRFREAYSPNNFIKFVWHQIDNTVPYTGTGSTPYSTKQVVDNAYKIFFDTGIFAADCQEWNKLMTGDKTLPHMEVLFVASHRAWGILFQNETGAPYGAAHNVTTNPDERVHPTGNGGRI